VSRKSCLCMSLCLLLLWGSMTGCGKEVAEIAVPETAGPQVEVTETAETAELSLDTKPGSILGEEEVILMLDGQPECVVYTRIQGNEDYSVAYDPEQFSVSVTEKEVRFTAIDFDEACETPVVLSIRTTEGESAEVLAEQYVSESNEECRIEEVTIGEGEYPAFGVSYAEGTEADSRTCDIYVLRLNQQLYVIQIDCLASVYENLGAVQHTILSTLRFHEG